MRSFRGHACSGEVLALGARCSPELQALPAAAGHVPVLPGKLKSVRGLPACLMHYRCRDRFVVVPAHVFVCGMCSKACRPCPEHDSTPQAQNGIW